MVEKTPEGKGAQFNGECYTPVFVRGAEKAAKSGAENCEPPSTLVGS